MADLRGEQLKDSYQNVVTRGPGNKLENGNGVEFADLDDKASLSEITLDLSSDSTFTSGQIKGIKIGNQVTLTLTEVADHSSASGVGTSSGFVPVGWRPTIFQGNVYTASGSIRRISVNPDGTLGFNYTNFDGTNSTETSTGSGPSITYAVD